MGEAVHGRFSNHPALCCIMLEQAIKGPARDRQCARVSAKGWHDQAAFISDKTFSTNGSSALNDGATGMKMAGDFIFTLFQFSGFMAQRDRPQSDLLGMGATQIMGGCGIMVAGDPKGFNGVGD